MRTSWIAALLLGGALFAHADDKPASKPAPAPQTPAQKLQALETEFDKQGRAFFKQYQNAKTPADQKKIIDQLRTAIETTSRQVLALAEANPKDPVAIKALSWILSQSGTKNDQIAKALLWIERDFVTRLDILPICQDLIRVDSPEAETALRAIHDRNPARNLRGVAGYGLAIKLLERADEKAAASNKAEGDKLRREAEQQFEDIIAKYGDVPYGAKTLGKKSQAFLFEVRNLAIGKKSPDIQGSDSDGKSFKLSDYRGKVVVLDFWARW